MSDILNRLREAIIADAYESGIISSGLFAERMVVERREAADEIERLRLFEYYANNPIEGMVEEAVAYKKQHGKYPFED